MHKCLDGATEQDECIKMGKITFFEEKKFQGRCYNCSSDCADLHTHFSRCSSIRVESGVWVIYARPSYKGLQCILTPGEYADNQQWMAFSDSVKSCRVIKNLNPIPYSFTPVPSGTSCSFWSDGKAGFVYGSSWKLRLYEKPDFGGQMFECFDDCPSVYDTYKMNEVHSCTVTDGSWVLYELPNYMGRQYVLERGDYRQHGDWGRPLPASAPSAGSLSFNQEFLSQ